MSWADLSPLLVPLVVTCGAFALLVADLFVAPESKRALGWATAGLLAAALVVSFLAPGDGAAFGGAYVAGPWTSFLQRVLLASALISVVGGVDHVAKAWPRRQGEYHLLLLLSLAGMLLLPGARDVVLLVTCFELMGIPLYLLAAYGKTEGTTPAEKSAATEAGLKFYLVGAASSAITLFGLALVVGLAGSTRLADVALAMPSPLLGLGALLALAGMGFKIGVVPFHSWVPDAYQGASTPFVSFLSVAPKIAGFAALVAVLVLGLPGQVGAWLPIVLGLALLTITAGNLLAIPQTSVKRVLAFSGVAQVGYVLMALAAGPGRGLAMMLFYLAAYVVTNAGAFLVAHAIATSDGDESVAGLDGLSKRSPWLALSLLLFLLSLAGIPFVAGFWAKLYVFVAAWDAGFHWIVLAGAVLAIVALFYYLGLAKAAYVSEPARAERVRVAWPLKLAILGCLAGVVLMGAWPRPVLEAAERASAWLGSSASSR